VKRLIVSALRYYKARISPQLPPACRYTPSCSEYAIEAIERRGVLVGGFLVVKRVISCNPFSRGGYDPVREARAR